MAYIGQETGFSMNAARGALEQAAVRLGFSALGVADATLPQGNHLRDWLEAGCHADMAWMERHLAARIDPHLLMPARLADASPAELAMLDEEAFTRLFEGSPIRRIVLAHMRENLRFGGHDIRADALILNNP